MLPIANLDVIPAEISTDLIFNFSDDKDEAYNDRLEEMGYDNHNAIKNIGSMIYFIAFYCILVATSLVLSIYSYNCCCWTRIKPFLPIVILMSSMYIIFFEGYLTILISCFLSLKGAIRINLHDKFSYRLSRTFPLILFVVIPLLLLYILLKPKEEL